MTFKKSGKYIFGVDLNSAEQKALDQEVKKQLVAYIRKHNNETIAMTLWTLRKEFGFGEARLRRFFDAYDPAVDALIHRYELGEEDAAWIVTQMLKEEGIDVEAWRVESSDT